MAPTWTQFIYGISIGTVAYTGIETISNMSEEAANPGKDVPRAINLVLAAVLVVYAGHVGGRPVGHAGQVQRAAGRPDDAPHGAGRGRAPGPSEPGGPFVLKPTPHSASTCPSEVHGDGVVIPAPGADRARSRSAPTGRYVTKVYGTWLGSVYLDDPVLGIVRNMPDSLGWLRAILGPWVGILAATILIIATNAGLIGVSRLAYSLGQHRQIPPILGRVHPKRLTPYVSIIVFGIVACLIIIPGSTPFLADLYAFGAMISFTTAHVVGDRAAHPGAGHAAVVPHAAEHPVPRQAAAAAVDHRRPGHVHRLVRRGGHAPGGPAHRLPWMAVGLIVYVVYRKARATR